MIELIARERVDNAISSEDTACNFQTVSETVAHRTQVIDLQLSPSVATEFMNYVTCANMFWNLLLKKCVTGEVKTNLYVAAGAAVDSEHVKLAQQLKMLYENQHLLDEALTTNFDGKLATSIPKVVYEAVARDFEAALKGYITTHGKHNGISVVEFTAIFLFFFNDDLFSLDVPLETVVANFQPRRGAGGSFEIPTVSWNYWAHRPKSEWYFLSNGGMRATPPGVIPKQVDHPVKLVWRHDSRGNNFELHVPHIPVCLFFSCSCDLIFFFFFVFFSLSFFLFFSFSFFPFF